MAWSTPPTFVDGAILTAAQLNILSEDVEYLYERAQQVNVARPPVTMTLGDDDPGEENFSIRHKFNTFEYNLQVLSGTMDYLTITYGSNVIFDDQTDRGTGYTYSGSVNITSYAYTVGTVYTVKVESRGEPGSGTNSVKIVTLQETP